MLQNIIPNYIFTHPELSHIFEQISKYDPAVQRGEDLDEAVIELMISGSPKAIVNRYISNESVDERILQLFSNADIDTHYVNSFFRFVYFWPNTSSMALKPDSYHQYMKLLYDWYSGNEKSIKPLYKLIQEAVVRWKGDAGKGKINVTIGRQQLEYRTSEKITIKPRPPKPPQNDKNEVNVFNTYLPVKFKVDGQEILLPVTYDLFELASKINNGYRPTTLDYSNYMIFNDFVEKAAMAGEGDKQVFFTESLNCKQQFVLELDDFGDFCFSEVAE